MSSETRHCVLAFSSFCGFLLAKQVQGQGWKQKRLSRGLGRGTQKDGYCKNECLVGGAGVAGVANQQETEHLHWRMGSPTRSGGARELTTVGRVGRGQTSTPGISPNWGPLDSQGSGCHQGKGKEAWRPLPSYSHVKTPQKELNALGPSRPKFSKV